MVTAVRAQAQQAAEQRHAQQLRAEDAGHGLEETARNRLVFLQALEAVRFRNVTAHPDDQQRWQQADEEHHAPGIFSRHQRVDQGEQRHRQAPAHGPGALHGAHDLAAVFRVDGFGHQHCASRPLAADAEALHGLDEQQRIEAGDESR